MSLLKERLSAFVLLITLIHLSSSRPSTETKGLIKEGRIKENNAENITSTTPLLEGKIDGTQSISIIKTSSEANKKVQNSNSDSEIETRDSKSNPINHESHNCSAVLLGQNKLTERKSRSGENDEIELKEQKQDQIRKEEMKEFFDCIGEPISEKTRNIKPTVAGVHDTDVLLKTKPDSNDDFDERRKQEEDERELVIGQLPILPPIPFSMSRLAKIVPITKENIQLVPYPPTVDISDRLPTSGGEVFDARMKAAFAEKGFDPQVADAVKIVVSDLLRHMLGFELPPPLPVPYFPSTAREFTETENSSRKNDSQMMDVFLGSKQSQPPVGRFFLKIMKLNPTGKVVHSSVDGEPKIPETPSMDKKHTDEKIFSEDNTEKNLHDKNRIDNADDKIVTKNKADGSSLKDYLFGVEKSKKAEVTSKSVPKISDLEESSLKPEITKINDEKTTTLNLFKSETTDALRREGLTNKPNKETFTSTATNFEILKDGMSDLQKLREVHKPVEAELSVTENGEKSTPEDFAVSKTEELNILKSEEPRLKSSEEHKNTLVPSIITFKSKAIIEPFEAKPTPVLLEGDIMARTDNDRESLDANSEKNTSNREVLNLQEGTNGFGNVETNKNEKSDVSNSENESPVTSTMEEKNTENEKSSVGVGLKDKQTETIQHAATDQDKLKDAVQRDATASVEGTKKSIEVINSHSEDKNWMKKPMEVNHSKYFFFEER